MEQDTLSRESKELKTIETIDFEAFHNFYNCLNLFFSEPSLVEIFDNCQSLF